MFEIQGNNKPAIQSVEEVTRTVEREGKKWDQSVNNVNEDITRSFTKAFDIERIKNWALKAKDAIIQFGQECIAAFSDLEEVQNVVDVTFGSSAGKINTWAQNAAAQFGLTETQAKRFTSTLGAMMKSAGLAGDQVAEMSMDMAGLAADMASFYNLDFDTAFGKIRAGISGETEPLRQLGINMSVANLQAYALAQGIQKPFNEMSQGEQIMLRYQYLMQATADAQGDFARTSDGYANSVRLLQTNLETLKTQIGQFIMPLINSLVSGLNQFLSLITKKPVRTVLDDFADIETETLDRLNTINVQAGEVRLTLESFSEILGGDGTLLSDEAIDNLSRMGIKSQQAEDYLRSLGYTTEQIDGIQSRWLVTCGKLVEDIPGLSEVIDTETGILKDGTTGIDQWVGAWEQAQTRMAQIRRVNQMQTALDTEYGDIPGLELTMRTAERRLRAAEEQWTRWGGSLSGMYDAAGPFDYAGNSGSLNMYGESATGATYREEALHLRQLKKEYDEANNEFQRRQNAYNEGVSIVREYRSELGTVTEEENAAAEAGRTLQGATDDLTASVETAREAYDNALDAMIKYAQQMYKTTLQSVNHAVGAFKSVETPADKAAKKVIDLTAQLEQAQEKGNIRIQIQGAEAEIPTALSMLSNLNDQLDFLQEYSQKIAYLKSMGLSEDVLAELSDGSLESLDYIRALSNNPEMIPQINQAFARVKTAKGELAQTLTENKLAVDEEFATLTGAVDTALENLAEAESRAYASGASIVRSIADGISSESLALQEAVNLINTILAGLGGGGIVTLPTTASAESLVTSFHAPERPMLDYGTMGQANGDHVRTGGDVYLNGRQVGRVLNDQAGQEYRNLTRSGVMYGNGND